MKPDINAANFGSITVKGSEYQHDILIRLNGNIEKHNKKPSKARFDTSHVASIEDAEYIYQTGTDELILGTGQTGQVKAYPEIAQFFQNRQRLIRLLPTPEALKTRNLTHGPTIGMFHVIC